VELGAGGGDAIDQWLDRLEQQAIVSAQRASGMTAEQRERMARILAGAWIELLRQEAHGALAHARAQRARHPI
jgi:hypothetical protein